MAFTDNSQSLLEALEQQIAAALQHDDTLRSQSSTGTVIHVPGTGKAISSAYEQLRNAAEYTEEHLLLQRAIRRFYKRNLQLATQHRLANLGEELIVELTQAGYLRNATFTHEIAAHITQLGNTYAHTYHQLRQAHVPRKEAADWILSIISVEIENLLNPHTYLNALVYVAEQHYKQFLPPDAFITSNEEAAAYNVALYIAVHQALLKSDIAIVRHDLMVMYQQTPDDITAFITFNRNVTGLFTARLTQRLKRTISKHGAPLRVLKSMMADRKDIPSLLHNRAQFLDVYDRQVQTDYRQVRKRANKGIVKSIVFILITKVIIGVGIEVPYDLVVVGSVSLLPLCINLLVPPLYMASLKLGLKLPSSANARLLHAYIDALLYEQEPLMAPMLRDTSRRVSVFAKVLYGLLFFIPFAVMVYVLMLLHFNVVQMIIFFVFLSTASFLGFRLSSMTRELELVSHQVTFLTTLRDFFYLPFILVGQWLSSKYARINAVAYVLDIAIELPLKTVLRLLRQWMRFLNEKHEELY